LGQRAVLRASLVAAGLVVSGVAAIAGPLLVLLYPGRLALVAVVSSIDSNPTRMYGLS